MNWSMDAQTKSPATPATEAQAATATQAQAPAAATPAAAEPAVAPPAGLDAPAEPAAPGFRQRGRMRRRARFLRRARELAYRDLGGLVFEMHRLGQRRDDLAAAKLETLGHIDAELRALEDALGERRAVTVLREAGIAACPRCAAIHGSDDRFCPICGLSMGRRADRPMTASPAPPAAAPAPAATDPAPAGAPRVGAPRAAAPPLAPAPSPPPNPAPPPPAVSAPVAAAPPRTPAGPDEDRPTEIIRPSDQTGA